MQVFALCDLDSHPHIPILIPARPDFISFDLIFELVVNTSCVFVIFFKWLTLESSYNELLSNINLIFNNLKPLYINLF